LESIVLNINEQDVPVSVERNTTLLYVLREILDLTGAKPGCNTGDCGACKVIIDGEAVNACLIQARNAVGKRIQTIEGLSNGIKLHPIQQAFVESGAIQCGYCSPGMIMTAKALLDKNPAPSRTEIKAALSNNLCRCTGYVKIIVAIEQAAELMRQTA
jgi:aerobic carbon-monoxide dehydrogenase small subunit